MKGYDFSKKYFAFALEHTGVCKPVHCALYHAILERANILHWPENFGLPTDVTMDMVGVLSYKTYGIALGELEDFGLINIITRSKNQYTANVIALVKNTKAYTKATTEPKGKCLGKKYQLTNNLTNNLTASIIKRKNVKTLKQDIPTNVGSTENYFEVEAEKKKKEKSSAQKEKETTPHWQRLVDVWFEFHEHTQREKPSFQGADPRSLKSILDNLQKRTEGKGQTWDEQQAVSTFQIFLQFADKDKWLHQNFLLPNLQRQLDKIINNGKSTATNIQSSFTAIDDMHSEGGGGR
jgi:hypothetical protein